ncbi:ABC transporter permease [Rhodospirillum centenum]|uniref:ABC transporter, permease protein, putative n=1 Tax=Rhodospirillum centenum (strain ATCC 51521 / SW) TaxID=414684 RepID=B6IP29_RHOCS|nr:ABC transporter permease [Rhodospirillum centenum]ACI99449.1 ABC transporter, permease protein, putative [Rhodospirillum centenum SW]
MSRPGFAPGRLLAMMVKEFIQMKRDRLTFAMMVGIPVLQLTLFGFAINSDPRHLPTAVRVADQGPFTRTLLTTLETTGYFRIVAVTADEAEADRLLERGEVQFVVTIPAGFARDLVRGDRPRLLVEADATDPAATGNAVAALQQVALIGLAPDLTGALAGLAPTPAPFELAVHRRYNPEGLTQYNVVPGLVGVVLTMTMVLMTALAVTRERERGTMENLLAMPIRPAEVMLGKILPFIGVGFVQVVLVMAAARLLFGVPMVGSPAVLLLALLAFIAANLSVGFLFSTVAKNQLQAMQMTFFFFLPSILLSGFMFPFRGMPDWAQTVGEVLPLTHFLRIVRGIMLKGNGLAEVWPSLWPLLLFLAVVATLALNRYRQTLD